MPVSNQVWRSHLKSYNTLLSKTNQYPCNITQNFACWDTCQEIHNRTISNLLVDTQQYYTDKALWHNSSHKLLDLIGPTNLFQIIKKQRSKDLVSNPFIVLTLYIFVTQILHHFSIKSIPFNLTTLPSCFLRNLYPSHTQLPLPLEIMKKAYLFHIHPIYELL